MVKPVSDTAGVPAKKNSLPRLISSAGPALLLVVLILLLRLPFHANYLTKWDSCNYALALEHFNIPDHTPHPPGYPLYILSGSIINSVLHDPNMSFIILGIILCSIAAIFLYLVGKELYGFYTGFCAALLFIAAPASWYLSSTALSYMSEAALVTSVLYLAIIAHRYPSLRWVGYLMAVVMGVGAGFRIPGFLMCLPLYLIHLADLNWKKRIGSIVIIFVIVATAYGWIIMKTGGWDIYRDTIASESVKHESALGKLIADPLTELGGNVSQIVLFNIQNYGNLWYLLFLPLLFPGLLFRRFTREKLFLLATTLAPLALFTLVYINLTAIELILLPMYSLILMRGFSLLGKFIANYFPVKLSDIDKHRASMAVVLILSTIMFISSGGRFTKTDIGTSNPFYEFNMTQIAANDLYVERLFDDVKQFDPSDTTLLLWMEAKHAGYYLRDYQVIWDKYVVRIPSPAVTEIFAMKGGRRTMLDITCAKTGKNTLICGLPLPAGCHHLIFRRDILKSYFPLERGLEARVLDEDIDLVVVDNIPQGAAIIVNRDLNKTGEDGNPLVTWSISPVTVQ